MENFEIIKDYQISGQPATQIVFSKRGKEIIAQFADLAKGLEPINIKFDNKYAQSNSFSYFDFDWSSSTVSNLLAEFKNFQLTNNLITFKHFINDQIDFELVRKLFTMFYMIDCHKTKTLNSSLYSNLGDTDENGAEFPPHCDFYIQNHMLLIYNDVNDNAGGETTFLPIEKFKNIIYDERSVFSNIDEILQILERDKNSDTYEEFYHALYKFNFSERKNILFKESHKLKFNKGEGFILNDNFWLHGRLKSNKPITQKRLIRYIYN